MPPPAIVHRYTFSFREAMAALLEGDQVDAESYEIRVVGSALVLDLVNPAAVPVEQDAPRPAPEAPKIDEEARNIEPAADGPLQTEEPAPAAEPDRPKGGPLATRAGILCNERAFVVFMDAASPDEAASELRKACGVNSRAEIDHDEKAAREFKRIETDYRVWLRAEDAP